jgi:hypothetical protein
LWSLVKHLVYTSFTPRLPEKRILKTSDAHHSGLPHGEAPRGGGTPLLHLLPQFRATGSTAYRAIRQEADENGSSALSMREIDRELATHRHQCRGVSRGEKT